MIRDLVGQTFSCLTVVEHVGARRQGRKNWTPLWRCVCACGNERLATTFNLRRGQVRSCGCAHRARDVLGKRFGRIVVEQKLDRTATGTQPRWLCRCDCGQTLISTTSKLHNSMRCKRCVPRTHGHASRGNSGHDQSPTYRTWAEMKRRCTDPGRPCFNNYGGRGISVCARWLGPEGFANFLADIGEKPSPGHSIDRIDVNGNYEPGNVRWATKTEQARNTRATKLEEHEATQIRWLRSEGITKTALAKFFGISITTVSRIEKGLVWA